MAGSSKSSSTTWQDTLPIDEDTDVMPNLMDMNMTLVKTNNMDGHKRNMDGHKLDMDEHKCGMNETS